MSIRNRIGRFLMYLVQPTLAPMLNEIIMHQNETARRLKALEPKDTTGAGALPPRKKKV